MFIAAHLRCNHVILVQIPAAPARGLFEVMDLVMNTVGGDGWYDRFLYALALGRDDKENVLGRNDRNRKA